MLSLIIKNKNVPLQKYLKESNLVLTSYSLLVKNLKRTCFKYLKLTGSKTFQSLSESVPSEEVILGFVCGSGSGGGKIAGLFRLTSGDSPEARPSSWPFSSFCNVFFISANLCWSNLIVLFFSWMVISNSAASCCKHFSPPPAFTSWSHSLFSCAKSFSVRCSCCWHNPNCWESSAFLIRQESLSLVVLDTSSVAFFNSSLVISSSDVAMVNSVANDFDFFFSSSNSFLTSAYYNIKSLCFQLVKKFKN